MKKAKLTAALALVLMVLTGSIALAEYPGAEENQYVFDAANVLTAETEVLIEETNAELYAAHSAQVVVITVDTTYPLDIMTFADMLFDEWELYSNDLERGVLLLLSIEDDDYALLAGRELETHLTDDILTEYADRFLEEDFAARDYDAGTEKVFGALCGLIDSIYSDGAAPDAPQPPVSPFAPDDDDPYAPTDPFWPEIRERDESETTYQV